MLYSYVLYWKMMFLKSNLMFCIEKWGMRISKNSFRKNLHSYVLYWKMRFLKSILLFCIEKWGFLKNLFWKRFHLLCIILKSDVFQVSFVLYWKMRIYKNSFLNKIPFLCIILKNDVFEVNSFVLYWKMRNEDFLKLFPKKFCILMYYIEKWGF